MADDDCYHKALPGEPRFTLLGRDRHAPALVWLWAAVRELEGEPADRVTHARDVADAMVAHAGAAGRPTASLGQLALVCVMELIRANGQLLGHDPAVGPATAAVAVAEAVAGRPARSP